VCGRRSRRAARSVARRRRARARDRVTRARGSVSVTLPWLATRSSSTRRPPCRATRRPRTANCLTTVPGARTTTTTPSRTRTATRAPPEGRVVSRTRASWSPGSAFRGTLAETRSEADVRAGNARRFGRSFSQAAAERAPRARRIRGLPRRVSAKPALETSMTRRFVPEFVRRTAVREVPARTTRAGAAVNATGVRVVLASAGASASTKLQTATRTTGAITDRSR